MGPDGSGVPRWREHAPRVMDPAHGRSAGLDGPERSLAVADGGLPALRAPYWGVSKGDIGWVNFEMPGDSQAAREPPPDVQECSGVVTFLAQEYPYAHWPRPPRSVTRRALSGFLGHIVDSAPPRKLFPRLSAPTRGSHAATLRFPDTRREGRNHAEARTDASSRLHAANPA